ncbi:hypothetical protein AAVH_20912 [Aphelenchoides avenae]|nr:hypothetical protein AAVH_20912 [Aphelenchus avenae]
MKKECDKCNHKCVSAAEILCDRCDIGHHYLCADMTQALADTIDKWYCERCKTEDPRLQVTFKPLAEPTSAKRKDLIAAKRRTLVKRNADVDADEPGPSKRTFRGSISCKLVESKATDAEAAQPTSEPAVADGPTQLSDTVSATATVGESSAFSRDENRQPRDAAVKLCQRETLDQSLWKTDPQRMCQTDSDASAEKHRVVVEK